MDVFIALLVVAISILFGYFAFAKSNKADRAQALLSQAPVALDERTYKPFPLKEKTQVNHNTIRFRFALPSEKHRLGLPVGKHMLLRFEDNDAAKTLVSRPYTPVSSDDELGYFDLIIKVYEAGKMTQHLKNLPVGGSIDCRGPLGSITYESQGLFRIKRKNNATGVVETVERPVTCVGMIAGGSGITPMLQIIRCVCHHPRDNLQISLIYANVTEEDILLREELDSYTKKFPNFKVYYSLDKPSPGWTMGAGHVSADMIKAHLPAPADDMLMLLCGPPPMLVAMQKHLDTLKYTDDMYFKY